MEAEKNGGKKSKNGVNPKPDDDHDQHHVDNYDDQVRMMNNPDEVQVPDQDQELLPFVCRVCKKRFKSGKGLGGHKTMHDLPPKNNKRKAIIQDNDDEEEEEDVPICFLCEKSFRSMKALCSHMRVHPDRGWKGIQPLSAVPGGHYVIDDDNSSPVSAKKGSGNRTTSGCSSSSEGSELLSVLDRINKNKGKTKKEEGNNHYVCNVCNSSFTSYQALGGHKSGHNGTKNFSKSKIDSRKRKLSDSDSDDHGADLSRSADKTAAIFTDDKDDVSRIKGDSKINSHLSNSNAHSEYDSSRSEKNDRKGVYKQKLETTNSLLINQ
ncbi:Zinc finger protein ZAT3 [Morus notabilis]|uniref:Zinc finger protein ZAT3 n=1 Tax=Morus notabilis TaxID=981085 RepID=W9RCW6_9ROSA|nr:zinc finger protein 62 [Morus notabilis]EXB51082.1 Zinc finger protein ZAT3 [Morus notabilis]